MEHILFPTITREQAIEIYRAASDYSSTPEREAQIKLLCQFLLNNKNDTRYSEDVVARTLKNFAPYTSQIFKDMYVTGIRKGDATLPTCIHEAYWAMFNAFDDFLREVIKEHWEVEIWDSPDGNNISSGTFYDKESAYEDYNAERLAGKYVRLIYVDEVTDEPEVLEISWGA